MGISFKVTKLKLREKNNHHIHNKRHSDSLKVRHCRAMQHHGQFLSSTRRHLTFHLFNRTAPQCLQLPALPLTNADTCPQSSVLRFNITQQRPSCIALPQGSLHYTAVMKFFTSVLLFTLLPCSSHPFMWFLPSSPALNQNMLPWSLS